MRLIIIALLFTITISNANAEINSELNIKTKTAIEAQKSEFAEGQDITYEQVLKNPDDLKLNFLFVKTQIRNGDIKGAAATLERILMINPKLADIRLFYATVLYRLENIQGAKSEVEKIKNIPMPKKLAEERDLLIKMILQREKKLVLSTQFTGGVSYDSNRNAIPSSGEMVWWGGTANPGSEKSDFAYLTSANMELARKFGKTGIHNIFIGGTYFRSDQDVLNNLSMYVMSARAGARLSYKKIRITPQALYDYVALDGNHYTTNAGASLRIEQITGKKTTLFAEGKLLDSNFPAYKGALKNPDRNATQIIGSIGLKQVLLPMLHMEASLEGAKKDARKEYYSSKTGSAQLRLFWLLGKSRFLIMGVSGANEKYEGPDIFVSPKTREDDIIRASLTFGLPTVSLWQKLPKDLSLFLTYEYYRDSSNIINYTYTNNKCQMMLTYRFATPIM